MEKELIIKPSKSYFKSRIWLFVLTLLLVGGLLIGFYYLNFLIGMGYGVYIAILAYFILFLLYSFNYRSKKITITKDIFTYQSLFKKRTLKIEDIELYMWKYYKVLGYTYDRNRRIDFVTFPITKLLKSLDVIQIIPKKGIDKRKINCFKSQELWQWLGKHATLTHHSEEQKVIDAGDEEKARIAKVRKFNIKYIVRYMSLIGIMFLIPIPFFIVHIVGLIAVVFIFYAIIYFKDSLWLEYPSSHPQTGGFVLVLTSATYFVGRYNIVGYNTLEDRALFITSIIITLLYILFIGIKKFRSKMLVMPVISIFILLSTAKISINYLSNFNQPITYQTTISSSKERSYDYYIRLKPWRDIKKDDLGEIEIYDYSDFAELKQGDIVQIKEYSEFFSLV